MNRQMRRIAARQREYKAPTVVPVPALFDEFAVFNDLERVLEKIEHGEIEHANGQPVMMAGDGHWYEIIPALNGWISAWKAFDIKFHLNHDLSALVRLSNCLNYATPIQHSLLDSAKQVLREQRRLFRMIPRDALASAARTEQIRLFLE